MAAKIECTKCHCVLKEEGDEMKTARGEYRVYESRSTLSGKRGAHRVIRCLACDHYMEPGELSL